MQSLISLRKCSTVKEIYRCGKNMNKTQILKKKLIFMFCHLWSSFIFSHVFNYMMIFQQRPNASFMLVFIEKKGRNSLFMSSLLCFEKKLNKAQKNIESNTRVTAVVSDDGYNKHAINLSFSSLRETFLGTNNNKYPDIQHRNWIRPKRQTFFIHFFVCVCLFYYWFHPMSTHIIMCASLSFICEET